MFFSLLRSLHIFAGVMGLVSGTLAMIFRKGSLLHAKVNASKGIFLSRVGDVPTGRG